MKGFKGMQIKTLKSLLILATNTATILTGCGSKDTESEIESEITTEVETATIEETTSQSITSREAEIWNTRYIYAIFTVCNQKCKWNIY
jgi:hypothetical protein